MPNLIVCEVQNSCLHPAVWGGVAYYATLPEPLHLYIAGQVSAQELHRCASVVGVSQITQLECDAAWLDIESLTLTLAQQLAGYAHVAVAASAWGNSVAPRLAAMVDLPCLSNVSAQGVGGVIEWPIFASSVRVRARCLAPALILSFRFAEQRALVLDETRVAHVQIKKDRLAVRLANTRINRRVGLAGDRPNLSTARVVVAGGGGVRSAAEFDATVGALAQALDAAIGATRVAVDAGYAPHHCQIGQTGCFVAPELYIAVGISGSIQHLAGIRGASTIVAINRDADCPMMHAADYALVGDLTEQVPKLLNLL